MCLARQGFRLLLVALSAAITLALPGVATAQQCQRGICCSAGAAGPDHNFQTARAIVGDTIDLRALTGNGDTAVCTDIGVTVTNVHFTIFHGDFTEVQGNLLSSPHQFTLPGCDPSQGASTTNVPSTTVANAADGVQGFLIVEEDVSGIENVSAGVNLPASTACQTPVLIFAPCLKVIKLVACQPADGNCTNASYSGFASGAKNGNQIPSFCYSITVTNCGTDNLTITNVSDTIFGDITGDFTNQTGVLSGKSLPVGASGTIFLTTPLAGDTTNTVTVLGTEEIEQAAVSASASATAQVLVASITVSKECDGGPFVIGQPIKFKGTVSNNGSVSVTGITVVDSVVGDVSGSLSSTTLSPGASATYNGSYASSGNGCGPFTNTVVATATEGICPNKPIEATATNVCTVITSPAIAVTKQCDGGPFVIGSPIKFKGSVTNIGNVTLVNVTVVDNTAAGTVLSGVTLAPGTSASYSGSYTASGCGPFTNVVTATGDDQCVGTPVSSLATSVCTIVTSPGIAVTKQCDGGPFALGDPIKFKGSVTNIGNVTLVNVTVVDSTAAGTVLSGVTLAPGTSASYSGSYTASGCGPFTNVVTATGNDQCVGTLVSSLATSVCTIVTAPSITVTKQCDGGPFALGAPIKFKGTVSNNGNVTLLNVTVVDSSAAGTVLSGVTLAPNASTNYSGSYTASGCGPFTNVVTATGNDQCVGTLVSSLATGVCTIATAPGIGVTKQCDGGPFVIGQPIKFKGSVTNSGNVTLINVTVVDSSAAGTVLSGVTLAPGASASYSGSYTPNGGCGPFTNVVTASGNDQCAGTPVSALATGVCTITTSPGIAVTKFCDFSTNSIVSVNGTVSNTGNVTLVSITVTDNVAGDLSASLSSTTLAPGASATYSGSYTATSLVSTDTVTATGSDQCTGNKVNAQATAVCSSSFCFGITKLVACLPPGGDCATASYSSVATGVTSAASGPPGFCYSITATNCGPDNLVITNVIDSFFGDITSTFTNALGSQLLPAFSSVSFTLHTNEAAGVVNVVTAIGFESIGHSAVSAQSSATTVVENVAITCEKLIKTNGGAFAQSITIPAINGNQTVIWSIQVNNAGSWPLTGVTISDPALAGSCTIPAPFSLGVAQSFTFLCTDTVNCADNLANLNPNQVTVSGQADSLNGTVCVIGTNGLVASAQSSCTASLVCSGFPAVAINKLIACIPPNTDCTTLPLTAYGKSATGVVNQALGEYPAFCYSITISNAGIETLTNIKVTDSSPDGQPNVSGCVWPDLAPGATETCTAIQATHKVNTIDIATVVGIGAFSGSSVTQQSSATAVVVPIGATCTKLANGVAGDQTITIASGSTTDISYSVVIHNTGSVDLQNIQGNDSGFCSNAFIVPFLAAGASVSVDLCVVTGVPCPPSPNVLSDTVTFTAEVSTNALVCLLQSNGVPVTVSNSCQNTMTIKCVQVGCRTTGGGKQPADNTCPVVGYVTHGGQVGAPFGASEAPVITDCATGAGTGFFNPCIRGEYQHVRHIKGGLRGTFHAAGNGNEHDFDSLKCACLPCDTFNLSTPVWPTSHLACHPQDRFYTGDGITENGLCNPDRMPNCGPEPRPAPANKICFSGVGDYTLSNGKKTENKVVFRVDIEDRGEPGNAHAIGKSGKSNPPDRYRMRMWIIDPTAVDSPSVRALRVAVACVDAHNEVVAGTLPCGQSINGSTLVPEPDIDDGGDLDRGNRQIHPNTGATCQ
ncbi:MAG TPA: hypothetical protein VNL17_05595 [Verrucomicrobiae bacterium]|nr:hypothetical protein [Verrucomicrobiae bacterium]